MSSSSNRTISHYRIREQLGGGGMGTVYRALDTRLERFVALKILGAELANQPAFRRQFIREARAIAMLDHPNIVRLYASQTDEAPYYLVMEYLPGRSLREYLRRLESIRHTVDPHDALEVISQIADALEYAHQNKIIHRDVKPENILLKLSTEFEADSTLVGVLSDWGLARIGDEEEAAAPPQLEAGSMDTMVGSLSRRHASELEDVLDDMDNGQEADPDENIETFMQPVEESQSGSNQTISALLDNLVEEEARIEATGEVNAIGTLAYRSPEQAWGQEVDNRTDIYSLGIVLYELIAGEVPFQPTNDMEAAEMHGTQPPPRLVGRRPNISTELEAVVFKAISKIPRDRYQTAAEFAEAIRYVQKRLRGQITDGRYTIITPNPILDEESIYSLEQYLNQIEAEQEHLPDFQAGEEIDESVDRIIVRREDLTVLILPCPEEMTINVGRDPNHEITLNSDQISRTHAVIERDNTGNFTVIDMGSTNGTYMDGVRLLSNVLEPWGADQIMTMGEFELVFEKGKKRRELQIGGEGFGTLGGVVVGTGGTPDTFDTPSSLEEKEPEVPKIIDVRFNQPFVTVTPGNQQDVTVELSNEGDLVEHYRVSVQGIPNDWFQEPPNTLQLLPGDNGNLPVVFNPERRSSATAGTHPFSLRIASDERGIEVARTSGLLTIPPFYEFDLESHPQSIRKYGLVQIRITNKSNAPDSYTISGFDKEQDVRFVPPNTSTTIPPGLSKLIELEVRPRHGRLIGGKKTFNYELEVQSGSGLKKSEQGELVARGVFPVWLVMLMIMLCILLVVLYFLFFRPEPQEEAAMDMPATSTNEGLRELLTVTAVRNETLTVNKTATAEFIQIATATTVAEDDPDGDGLINAEEDEAGTDRNNFDTDSDGLNDLEEVRLGTDPLANDTDEDTLLDGDEVRIYGTSPRAKDTDGDGLFDNIEVEQTFTDPNRVDTDGDGSNDGADPAPLDPGLPPAQP